MQPGFNGECFSICNGVGFVYTKLIVAIKQVASLREKIFWNLVPKLESYDGLLKLDTIVG
jgi:hypothetical protein